MILGRLFSTGVLGRVAFFLVFVLSSFLCGGDVHVRGYTRNDGTYVQPYVRSSPDHSEANNFITRGNVNPYTGVPGTKSLGGSAGSYFGGQVGGTVGGGGGLAIPHPNPIAAPASEMKPPAPAKTEPYIPPTIVIGKEPPDQILEFQQRTAAKGAPESMRAMGIRYLGGIGVEKDEVKGREWLQKAADKGDFQAKKKLKDLKL